MYKEHEDSNRERWGGRAGWGPKTEEEMDKSVARIKANQIFGTVPSHSGLTTAFFRPLEQLLLGVWDENPSTVELDPYLIEYQLNFSFKKISEWILIFQLIITIIIIYI